MMLCLLQKVRVKVVETSVFTTDFSECTMGVQDVVKNRVDKGGVEDASKKECLEDMANAIVFSTRPEYFHLHCTFNSPGILPFTGCNERCTDSGLRKGF
jgi:hypothetical protein